jgi:hypothetical protein
MNTKRVEIDPALEWVPSCPDCGNDRMDVFGGVAECPDCGWSVELEEDEN